VRLSGALTRCSRRTRASPVAHDSESHQVSRFGSGEGHVRLAVERLKRRFQVGRGTTGRPLTAYRGNSRSGLTQRGRHKKQTGGHGQFATSRWR